MVSKVIIILIVIILLLSDLEKIKNKFIQNLKNLKNKK
uniref:Uncharacterized protein n=1 Tax=Salisapilia bahamensis TaxID=758755 RepID=G4X7M2_9STRA|nr:unknown [Salisapilia bahamensis]